MRKFIPQGVSLACAAAMAFVVSLAACSPEVVEPETPLSLAWQVPVTDTISQPTVSDGLVFFVDEYGKLIALDVENGTERWQVSLPVADHSDEPVGADGGYVFASAHGDAGKALAFDAQSYLAANRDLAVAFGGNVVAAAAHYSWSGRNEGRSLGGFDALGYLGANPDVLAAVGVDAGAAIRHYLAYGAREGRMGPLRLCSGFHRCHIHMRIQENWFQARIAAPPPVEQAVVADDLPLHCGVRLRKTCCEVCVQA